MTHAEKLKMARKMLTNKEKTDRVTPFIGKAWSERSKVIAAKELKRHTDAEKRREVNKKLLKIKK